MNILKDDNAYDILQYDIENNFHKYINKNEMNIESIVIVGAYHGYEIMRLLHKYPKAIVYAFEAHPSHFKVLSDIYKGNNRVVLINKAVSDTIGYVNFYELGNGGEGSGSLLKFSGTKYGHPFFIKEVISVESVTLKDYFGNTEIDLLWVDVQGAELKVLKGTNISLCKSLFLEIHTHDYKELWDKEPYDGMCFKEDLENYLKEFHLHSIGLDNKIGNGQGNSFWVRL